MPRRPSDEEERSTAYEFGAFQLLPSRRRILQNGLPVELGDRAFDLLLALVEGRGSVLGKSELMDRVWPGRIVEENALQAQMSAIRRTLGTAGKDLIKTVAGRGYLFDGDVVTTGERAAIDVPRTNIPERVSDLIGRQTQVAHVLELLATHRLVSLTGAGGVGKTMLALEVARQLSPNFVDGVWLVRLAPLSDPELIAATLASVLELRPVAGAATTERICAMVGLKEILIVLDNCEHLIAAAAHFAEKLLQSGPSIRIVATSRESLQAEGECLYRVPPLDVPPPSAGSGNDVLAWGAVRLFVERVREATPIFVPDQRLLQVIASICRRLDGIPLAVELAAKRAAALGVDDVASRLDDRFGLLTGGKRTALPHQQTLRATLDWSFELLSPLERSILLRLSIFAGTFSLDAVVAVAASAEFSDTDTIDALANLVAKSLVTPDRAGSNAGYQLLETTRAYALERLRGSGEYAALGERHALYYNALFERAAAEWDQKPSEEWLATYQPCIDSVRAALDWCFSAGGTTGIGIALTAAAVPLWFQLSLMDECLRRVEHALAALPETEKATSRIAMQLLAAHGWSLYTTTRARVAWKAALDLAQQLDDSDYSLRALWGLWATHINSGEFPAALSLAQTFIEVGKRSRDPADVLVGERMVGSSLHFLGDQRAAKQHTELMMRHYGPSSRRSHIVRFQFDQRVCAEMILSRILWLEGLPDQALQTAARSVDDAIGLRHSLSLGNILAQAACPVALLCGDLEEAARYVAMFRNYMDTSARDVWKPYGTCFSGMLRMQRGDLDGGITLLQSGLIEMQGSEFTQYQTAFLCSLSEGLLRSGRVPEAVAAIEDGALRVSRTQEKWLLPELLRVKGMVDLVASGPSASTAEATFRESIAMAVGQGALAWELRTSISLAELWIANGRSVDACALLSGVRSRFTEGFATADMVSANALLESLT